MLMSWYTKTKNLFHSKKHSSNYTKRCFLIGKNTNSEHCCTEDDDTQVYFSIILFLLDLSLMSSG